MNVSSRTPEGESARCPICRATFNVEKSLFFGDATCPQCGHLVWIVQLGNRVNVMEMENRGELREKLLDRAAAQLGVSRDKLSMDSFTLEDLGADSLDTIELVMELEEEFA